MRSFRRYLFSCAVAAIAISPSAAVGKDRLQIADLDIARAYPEQETEDEKFPLEAVLNEIHRKFGWSFIFDSRVVAGKAIKPIKSSAELTERAQLS